jgi:hypothetical protein
MTKTKVATTREESLKLIELGLDPDTADMYWSEQREKPMPLPHDDAEVNDSCVPAWTAGRLLDALPVIDEDIHPIIERCWNGRYACKYMHFYEIRETATMHIRRFGETPVDAAYAMMKYMLTGYREDPDAKEE